MSVIQRFRLRILQVIEKREDIDWKRHFVFVTFGFVYLGGFQYYLYNVKFTQADPLSPSKSTVQTSERSYHWWQQPSCE